jgi:hypothetical protein
MACPFCAIDVEEIRETYVCKVDVDDKEVFTTAYIRFNVSRQTALDISGFLSGF